MTTEELLRKYQKALETKAKGEIEAKVLEMQAQLMSATAINQPNPANKQRKQKTAHEKFIDKYYEHLTADDLEFTKTPAVTPAEIAIFTGISEGEARRRIGSGIYKPGRGDKPGGKRFACSMSVVEHLIGNVATKAK